MRRFILGWKALGHARRFRAEIVNYADDLCVLGKAPAAETLAAVERLTLLDNRVQITITSASATLPFWCHDPLSSGGRPGSSSPIRYS